MTNAAFAIAAFITLPLSYLSMYLFRTLHPTPRATPAPRWRKILLLAVRIPISLAFLAALLGYYYLKVREVPS